MRKLLQYLLKRPLTWMAARLSSSPKKADVFRSLDGLHRNSLNKKARDIIILDIDITTDNFILFSDQHKGNKSWSDDFKTCEANYIAALQYYHSQHYHYINLGDCEELWKYTVQDLLPHIGAALQAESAFQSDKKYYRTFGNHDLIWKNKLDVDLYLKNNFSLPLPVKEAIALRTVINGRLITILLTHGHQGDKMSDNNALSTWFVAHLWTPLQRYLRINVNTPSRDDHLRNKHNKMMYEWSSSKKDLLLVTGHTHQPVFASGKYSDHMDGKIAVAGWDIKPSYFNTGCCCFSDGDITGIEIAGDFIRLVKWEDEEHGSRRVVLEEISWNELLKDL